jgi:hypothetical protein
MYLCKSEVVFVFCHFIDLKGGPHYKISNHHCYNIQDQTSDETKPDSAPFHKTCVNVWRKIKFKQYL